VQPCINVHTEKIENCKAPRYDRVVHESFERIAIRYRRFADIEAEGRSPLYAHLAREVSHDRLALEFLAELPSSKQQPNLFFAAIRYTSRTPKEWSDCRRLLASHHEEIRRTMLARRTQTNEPARCATLLPLLATIPNLSLSSNSEHQQVCA
jgi:Uncharacterized protein conserved in bacteria (DUF2332)